MTGRVAWSSGLSISLNIGPMHETQVSTRTQIVVHALYKRQYTKLLGRLESMGRSVSE